jgi:hypothetical protein
VCVYGDYCANGVSNKAGYDMLGIHLGGEREEVRIEFRWGSLLEKNPLGRERRRVEDNIKSTLDIDGCFVI